MHSQFSLQEYCERGHLRAAFTKRTFALEWALIIFASSFLLLANAGRPIPPRNWPVQNKRQQQEKGLQRAWPFAWGIVRGQTAPLRYTHH